MGVSTKVLPEAILNVIKRSKLIYFIARSVRFKIGSILGARTLPGLDGRVHYNDFMLWGSAPDQIAGYHAGAVKFVGILEDALSECGRSWTTLERCLEVGCGYGRVIRPLIKKLPSQKMWVCDVLKEGANFTSSEFGVHKIPIIEQLGTEYKTSFDLIYLLSVYTHLKREDVVQHIEVVSSLLKPGGVLVFTTHGSVSAKDISVYRQFWLKQEAVSKGFNNAGYYYEKYPHYYRDYGLVWFSENYMKELVSESTPDLKFIKHTEAGLDQQDVFVYQKR